MLLAGCAKSAPPVPPQLELVRPVRDLTAERAGNRVVLHFTLSNAATDGGGFRAWGPVRICRGLAAGAAMVECREVAAALRAEELGIRTHDKAAQKVAVTYEDVLPAAWQQDSAGAAVYAVELANKFDRSAGLGNVVKVPTAAALAAPGGLHGEIGSEGVTLAWQPVAGAGGKYEYRVERYAAGGSDAQALVCSVALGTETHCVDTTMEWEKPLEYAIRVVTLLPEKVTVLGDASARVAVLAHDVFPPAVPQGVQAVASGAGQLPFVDLTWTPDADVDLAGYDVYRRDEGGVVVKLNAAVVLVPSYKDDKVSTGHKYTYLVTAVDVRGNESAKSDEASELVP